MWSGSMWSRKFSFRFSGLYWNCSVFPVWVYGHLKIYKLKYALFCVSFQNSSGIILESYILSAVRFLSNSWTKPICRILKRQIERWRGTSKYDIFRNNRFKCSSFCYIVTLKKYYKLLYIQKSTETINNVTKYRIQNPGVFHKLFHSIY